MDNQPDTEAMRLRNAELVSTLEDFMRETLCALHRRDPVPASSHLSCTLAKIANLMGSMPDYNHLRSAVKNALVTFEDPQGLTLNEEVRLETARVGMYYLAFATDTRGRRYHISRLTAAERRFDNVLGATSHRLRLR